MDKRVLASMTFISTRPAGKSEELKECLAFYGASLIEMPTIEIVPATLSEEENELLLHLDRFQWIIFTSAHGILHFFTKLKDLTGSYTLSHDTRIAVIGHKTAAVLSRYEQQAHYINPGTLGKEFASNLADLLRNENHPRVLFPAGNLAGDTIFNHLENVADVVRINVYLTQKSNQTNDQALKRIVKNEYAMIIVTSPSALQHLLSSFQEPFPVLRIACIGKTTAEAAIMAGICPFVVSETMDSRGIVKAIRTYYTNKNLI